MKRLIPTLALVLLPAVALAGDWPEIRGPNRDGQAQGETLLTTWPKSGPNRLWSIDAGEGFSGVVVAQGRAILFDRVGKVERLQSLDPATGEARWKAEFPTAFRGGINPDSGPRTTPLVHGKQVFAYGAEGNLYAVDAASGEVQWTRSLEADYRAPGGYFGAGNTPIVHGGLVLVNVGGRDAGIVGLNPATGKTVWEATDERGSYASAARFGDEVIFVTRLKAMQLDPATGKIAWEIPFGMRGPTVNGAVPLVQGKRLFLTAAYRVGARWIDLSGAEPDILWENDTSLSSQYSAPVLVDGYLYGTHGREDFDNGIFRCVEAATGEVQWTVEGAGIQFVIAADAHLLLWNIDGTLTLLRANPARYEKLAEASITGGLSRSQPALANGRLYLRATPGKVVCLDVGAEK